MMVSNVQNSAQTPPLSYADRVKKSQRANAASSTSSQRPPARSQPSSASVSVPPTAAKGAKSPDTESAAKQPQGAPPAPVDLQPSPPDTPRKASESKPVNGQASSSSVDPVAGPSSTPVKKTTAPPAVNVWNLRKERMAQAHTQQPGKGSESSPLAQTSTTNDPGPISATPATSSSVSASIPAQKEPEASSSAPPPKAAAADSRAPTEEDDDPWVVRPNRAPAAVLLPRLDATSWPEVGKPPTSVTNPAVSNGERDDKSKRETQSGGQKRGKSVVF